MEKVLLSVRLTKEFSDKFTEYCKRTDQKKTEVVRRLLRDHLSSTVKDAKEKVDNE